MLKAESRIQNVERRIKAKQKQGGQNAARFIPGTWNLELGTPRH